MAQKDTPTFQLTKDRRLHDPKLTERLAQGKRIRKEELSLQDQLALDRDLSSLAGFSTTLDPKAEINLQPEVLAQLQQAQAAQIPAANQLKPFQNLQEILNAQQLAPTQPVAPAAVAGPQETVVSQSDVVSGGIEELLTRLANFLRPKLQLPSIIPDAIASSPAAGPVGGTTVTGIGELLQRLVSDITKQTKQIVPSQTAEQVVGTAAEQQFPELASRKDVKGLRRFAGAGQFRVGGVKYKIDEAGRIVKIG